MVSRESREYKLRLHETPAFGASGFDLEGLRQGMATRREPSNTAIRCIRSEIDGISSEWVRAGAGKSHFHCRGFGWRRLNAGDLAGTSRPPTPAAESRYHAIGVRRPDLDWRVAPLPGGIRPHYESQVSCWFDNHSESLVDLTPIPKVLSNQQKESYVKPTKKVSSRIREPLSRRDRPAQSPCLTSIRELHRHPAAAHSGR